MKAEGGHLCIEQDPHLLLKLDRDVRLIGGECTAQGLDVSREGRQASRKCFAAGGVCTLILHRDPQIDRERFGSEPTNLSDHILNC